MQTLIDKIMRMPEARSISKKLVKALDKEEQKRLKFYNEITEQHKAEFINGEIVIHSPVMKRHSDTSTLLVKLLATYVDKYELGFLGVEKILIQLTRNDYEPDICFFKKEKAQKFKDDQVIFPAPDWVVEVLSKSTAKNDKGLKFKDYQSHQIEEYWIIAPKRQRVMQYHLENGKYELVAPQENGNIKSFVITNFEIPIKAIFDKNINLNVLKEILN